MPGVTEGNGECARARRADERSVVCIPGVGAIPGGEDPRRCSATGGEPCVPFALGSYTSSARGERKFAWQCRRHIRADVVPSFSISGTEIGEHSVYRVAVRDTTFGGPEGETIVERVGCLVLELHGPGRTTIDRFVDAKVGGVVSNGLQVSDLVAHALDVA